MSDAQAPRDRKSKPSAEGRLVDRPLVIGREDGCDIVLNCDRVSRRHAKVFPDSAGLSVEDLGSVNGTLLNDLPLQTSSPLRVGDILTIGTVRLELTSDGRLRQQSRGTTLVIEARGIAFDAGSRRLLSSVSLTMYSGEFVGLMGPSGSGKTTLMNLLNGYLHTPEGTVLFNGRDLHAQYAQISGLIGYVPQDDIMHRELTVEQALQYTARLRLPATTTDVEIEHRITHVLKQLQIEGTRHTRIGSPERKGISGGQRKRVNLAMELLTDPAILFLDEPTSGLSSQDALVVMTLLRRLTDLGKCILLTVHQPSREAFRLMDLLAIVSRDLDGTEPGKLVYFGPAFPDAIHFFHPNPIDDAIDVEATPGVPVRAVVIPDEARSPDEVLRGLATKPTREWLQRFRESGHYRKFVEQRVGRLPSPAAAVPVAQTPPDVVSQCFTLVKRSLAIKIADGWNTTILLAQAPIVALLVILVFGERARDKVTAESWVAVTNATAVTLFLLCLSSLWFGCSNAAREIVGEWAIYHRERMVSLQLSAYVISKVIVGAMLCAVQCAILLAAARLGCGLRAPIGLSFVVMMLTACTGIGIGLIISAVARTQEIAMALLPLVLIPMVIFGGTLLPIHDMQRFIRPVAYVMPTRHGFEAMLLLEAGRKPLGPSPFSNTIETDRSVIDEDRPDIAENYLPKNRRLGINLSVVSLAVLFVATIIAVLLILRFRDVH